MIEVQDMLADELAEICGITAEFAIFGRLGKVFVEGDGPRVFGFASKIAAAGFVGVASSA